MTYLSILFTFILVTNPVLNQFLGLCPFIGVSKKLDSAIGMGFAVTFVMTIANMVTWILANYVLMPYNLMYLETITFILVIASLVQFVEMVINKYSPSLYKSLGIFLPLIVTNCAVLGIALLVGDKGYTFMESIVAGIASGLGFMLALILMAGVREKVATEQVPAVLRGLPIAFISGGLIALTFMAFDQALIKNLFG